MLEISMFFLFCFFARLFPERRFVAGFFRRLLAYLTPHISHTYLTPHISHTKKYVNIPSEKYIYVHIYVCICVYTYLCKMDERRSYASLSKKWMSTGIVLACLKNG